MLSPSIVINILSSGSIESSHPVPLAPDALGSIVWSSADR